MLTPTLATWKMKYVQRFMIEYIEVDCYEHTFKYGSANNVLRRCHNNIVERVLLQEEIDFDMLYEIVLTIKNHQALLVLRLGDMSRLRYSC